MTAMTFRSTGKAAIALAVSTALAASLALAAPATAQAKTVKAPAKVKKPTVSKIKATSFKVSWKKAKRAKGYQVKVLKGSRTVKTITVKKKSCYATGLSSKTTYKVKVRAYNQSGKKTKYGKWSAARSVITAKASSSSSSNSGSNSSKVHTHSWSTDSCVGGSTRIYYCLQCGKFFEDKANLEAHATSEDHFQQTWDGYIYEKGFKRLRSKSTQDGYAYSYFALKKTTLASASDHCSCGATREHSHSWKRVSAELGARQELNSRYACICGWSEGWLGSEESNGKNWLDHCAEVGWSPEHGSEYLQHGYGYISPHCSYDVCSGCGLTRPVV